MYLHLPIAMIVLQPVGRFNLPKAQSLGIQESRPETTPIPASQKSLTQPTSITVIPGDFSSGNPSGLPTIAWAGASQQSAPIEFPEIRVFPTHTRP